MADVSVCERVLLCVQHTVVCSECDKLLSRRRTQLDKLTTQICSAVATRTSHLVRCAIMLASVVLPVPGGPQNCAHVSARHQGRVSAQSSMGESGRRGGAARAPPRRAVHSDPRSGPGTERGRMSRARNEGPRRTLGRILSARVRGRPVSGGGGGGETEFCALRLEGGAPPSSSSSSASTSMGSIVCTQRASTSTTPHRAGGRGAAWRGTAPPPACRGTASSRARATNERSVEPCKNQSGATGCDPSPHERFHR